MRTVLLLFSIITLSFFASQIVFGIDLTVDQNLIVACYKVDLEGVKSTLKSGAHINARFGSGDEKTFQDPWTHGWPMTAAKWTPLIALASSSKYPDPPRQIQNTTEDLDWAQQQQQKLSPSILEKRKTNSLEILELLLSRKPDLDLNDGYGATALYESIYEKKLEMSKRLLSCGAKVNTKTRIYIDGTGDDTPLHRAYWSPELTKLLLEKGADPNAKDTAGETPFDWTKREGNDDVIKLYKIKK